MAGVVNSKGLIIVVVLIALFLLMSKKSPPPGDGPAVPSGSVGTVNVAQASRMSSHLAHKLPNQELDVVVAWTPTTRNSAGSFIPWDYQLVYGIYTTAGGLVRTGTFATFTGIGGNGNVATTQRFLAGVATLGSYDLRMQLWGKSSNNGGQPVLPYVALGAEAVHPSAFMVMA